MVGSLMHAVVIALAIMSTAKDPALRMSQI
jgi:hypothetical protein